MVLTKTANVAAAIVQSPTTLDAGASIPARCSTPTPALISDAEVAEIDLHRFRLHKTPVTARLIVRRVRDQSKLDELFPLWRYHPFFTNSTEPS